MSGFSIGYCCEQIEKVQTEVFVDQLRRLAAESEGRLGSRGNTARLLRVVAARLERDQAEVVAELREMARVCSASAESSGCRAFDTAADLVAEKLVSKK